ncbi:Lrp/AsnC family transcriptional regulator [Salinicola halophilus]|uniref:Lrp/AsnC family transcriptional regulator n=1 Tax=Salinicola halophilus TaxID=184065 RepID=UPI000DA23670|nr:Lrp/AsnC family transcriptional regulator [Salinicola halophilus]
MDRLDKRILEALQRDASRTNLAIAEAVGLSPSSCLRRIRRLRADGMIDRTVAILDPARTERRLKALVNVELARHGDRQVRQFLALATAEPAVMSAYAVTGESDVILMLRLVDMAEFDALCERLFRDQTNVARFFTAVVTRTAKEETAIPL